MHGSGDLRTCHVMLLKTINQLCRYYQILKSPFLGIRSPLLLRLLYRLSGLHLPSHKNIPEPIF